MAYTPAQIDAATTAMVAGVPGMNPDTARAWVTAEQGDFYNIEGVTYLDASGTRHLYRYSSWAQGAAAVWRLLQSPYYTGIRMALGGSSQEQARAIIASPWNHPYYSGPYSGSALLRTIANSVAASGPNVWTLTITEATPVYDRPGGTEVDTAYAMTARAARSFTAGAWWYQITVARLFTGRWLRATGTFTAHRGA